MIKQSMYYSDLAVGGTSNKEWHCQVEKSGSGYAFKYQFGKRGETLQTGEKQFASLAEAEKEAQKKISEKFSKGYKADGEAKDAPVAPSKESANRTPYPAELLAEIGEDEAKQYVDSKAYWMQLKYDGHRRQIVKIGDAITGYGKKGEAKPLPKPLAKELAKLPDCVLDGELIGDDYWAFDLLSLDGMSIATEPYETRHDKLRCLLLGGDFGSLSRIGLVSTWKTVQAKRVGLGTCKKNLAEGVVFKPVAGLYRAGDNGQQKKFKFVKSASCIVSAVGVGGKDNAALSVIQSLAGPKPTLVEVGHASTIGKGKIKVGDVVEVKFLYVGEGRRLVQPRIVEVRDDVDVLECTFSKQLPSSSFKQGVAA